MAKVTKNAILETVKEAGRIAVFAGVSALVAWATNKLSGLDPNSTFVVVGTLVLRLLDKWVHVSDRVSLNGLVKF